MGPRRRSGRSDASQPGQAESGVPVSLLARAVRIMRCFTETGTSLTLAELSSRSGLPKSTTHRLVTEMVRLRLLDKDAEEYHLGMWLFEVGEMVPAPMALTSLALPIMEDLREATRKRIHLAVLDGNEVVYVQILGRATVDVTSRPGGRLPAHVTGVGKVLLAYSAPHVIKGYLQEPLVAMTPHTVSTAEDLLSELAAIRSVGMALDREESHLGITCVAAPVFGPDRKIHAALSITDATQSLDPMTFGPAVRTAAFTLSRLLRSQRPDNSRDQLGRRY